MSESKHTSGPWGYEKTGDQLYRHVITAAHPYSDTHSLYVARQIEEEADARLIAAAPDLLEALKGFVAKIDPVCLVEHDHPEANLADELREALAAVAKAEGRS